MRDIPKQFLFHFFFKSQSFQIGANITTLKILFIFDDKF